MGTRSGFFGINCQFFSESKNGKRQI